MTAQNQIVASGGGSNLIALLPSLIQQDITLISPANESGIIYSARVLGVDGPRLRINLPRRIAGNGYLRSSKPVIINYVIDHQLFECHADYHAENEHMRELVINGKIECTTRRHHTRHQLHVHAGYTPVSHFSLLRKQFANLRWKKSNTLDLSAGGVLLHTPFQAPVKSYLLMNLEIPAFQAPLFVFGQVRWFSLSDINRKLYLCGIRFILREELSLHFSERVLSELPPIMLPFDKNKQSELDAYLTRLSGNRKQGDYDDD